MSTKKKSRIHIDGDKLVLIAAIIVVFALFTCLNKNFLSVTNMINILIAASLVGMVAVGHTYLIIAGQNDLSPGSLAAFSGVVAALLVSKGMPFAAAVIVTIVCGAAVGFFNAFMVNKIHLEAFIATLVTQSIIRGFAYIICGGKPVSISNKTFLLLGKARILNIPVSVWIMIICIVVFGIILIQSFNTGLTMVNVPSFWQYVAKGGLLLFALTTDYIRKQKREKDLLAASMKNL